MSEIPPNFTEYPRAPVYRPRIRFEVISEAWRFMMANPGVWAFASFMTLLLTMALFVPFYVLAFVQMIGSGPQQQIPLGAIFAMYGYLFIACIMLWVGQSIGLAGMYNLALKQIQGYEISIRDYFSTGGSLFSHLGAGMLFALAVMIGSFFCYLPGLIFGGLLMLAHPLIVHRRLGAIDALKTSWNMLKGDLWTATGFYLVISLVASLGSMACGVGMLLSYPLMPLGIALIYRDYTLADPAASNQPYAPYNIMDR